MTTFPLVVAEFDWNGREVLRVQLDQYNGRPTFTARIFYPAVDGEWKPGKNGLTLGLQHLEKTAKALSDAVAHAKAHGLLKEPTAGDGGADE
jgi:hypothetical protein